MKKIIILLAVFSIAMNAQSQFGIKGGINLANLSGDDAPESKPLVSFHAGVFHRATISEMFSVVTNLQYSGEGARDKNVDDLKVKLDYLNFNPTICFTLKSGIFVTTGPQVGYLLGAKFKDGDNSINIMDDYKPFSFSYLIEIGFDFRKRNKKKIDAHFGLFTGFYSGLSAIAEDTNLDVKSSVFQAGFSYEYLKKLTGK